MSSRMIRRLDLIAAYGRLLALLGVVLATTITFPLHSGSDAWPILIVTAVKIVVDAIPVILLYARSFPDEVAFTFPILDSLFSLILLYLGGPGMLFYCFVPILTLSVRFEWLAGLIDGTLLAAAYWVIVLSKASFAEASSVLAPAILQSFPLILVSALGGLLAENVKNPPAPNVDETEARDAELRRLQAAADRARAIYEMSSMLSVTLDPDKILDAVLEISAVGFEELADAKIVLSNRPAGAVYLYGQDGLYIAAARGISYLEMDLAVKGEQGALSHVLSRAEPLLLDSLADDPELRQYTPFRRCRAAICVPMRAGFELYGAVVFASPTHGVFGEEHVELATAVANQAVVALIVARLYRDLQEEKERIIEVEEETRTRVARDLHDGPTQSIAAIAMRLNFVRLLLDRDPQKAKDELFKLEDLARRTTKEIRTMLFTLHPVVLETQGLKAAVEQLVEGLREPGGPSILLEIEEELEDRLDVNLKAVAWFTTEESLNNAIKHAQAERIWVRMYVEVGSFVVEIEDDGDGFDFEATMLDYDQRGSFGLLNLKERADLVNGRTTIQSVLGEGTLVTLVAPLNPEII
ncbi:MAG: GAF domain-containing sensor histidine kinase [Anaerolineae bacterium]|nr:GAF domain-containing sensor histidine kinase [Anaerolineae bacterium]